MNRRLVLAIESSCDDACVALIRRGATTSLLDHRKATLDSAKVGGIIPIDAMSHHLKSIGPLIQSLLKDHNYPKIDLVCATRGPGMYSSLAAGLQVGKGLAAAWNVPFVGVHHMLGHLLTPRFFENGPKYPFFSLLISGGHTLLVLSTSIREHIVVADTIDIAAGNALDKCARLIGMEGVMLGKELDKFVAAGDVEPVPFEVALPLEKAHKAQATKSAFSFAHFASLMPRIAKTHDHIPLHDQPPSIRRAYGQKFQQAIFTHILRKTEIGIKQIVDSGLIEVDADVDFVLSGGVAANSFLRDNLHKLNSPVGLRLHRTPLEWCTDNALMIGWAGIEMYESGITSELDCLPIAKWPLSELGSV